MSSAERKMELRGNPVTRYRVNTEGTAVHLYLDVVGEWTLAELIRKVSEAGAFMSETTFRGGCFVLTMPATDEDRERWRLHDEAHEAKSRNSRREAYDRLRAEFEDQDREAELIVRYEEATSRSRLLRDGVVFEEPT